MNTRKFLAALLSAGIIASLIPTTSLADTSGWRGNYNDGWRYYTSDTEYVKNNWEKIDGNWYYFKEDGIAIVNAWAFIDGKLYHFSSTGAMEKNKWIDCGEHKLSVSQEKHAGIQGHETYADIISEYRNIRDWRYVGSDGAAYTGWKKINGEWYCFEDSYIYEWERQVTPYGLMCYGWYTDKNGDSYNFDCNGKYRKNGWYLSPCTWYEASNNYFWCYFDENGHPYSGWKQIDNKWYYFYDDTSYDREYHMATGFIETNNNGKQYWYLSQNGAMNTGWIYDWGDWHYAKKNGECCCNEWLKDNGKWYYFDKYGDMISNTENLFIDGKLYNFDSNGVCTNYSSAKKVKGWWQDSNTELWYYVNSDGSTIRNNWQQIDGDWYYFRDNGDKICAILGYAIDGKLYDFDDNGKCLNPYQNRHGWQTVTYGGLHSSQYDYQYYFGEDGRFYTGWHIIDGKWYYFGSEGTLFSGIFKYNGQSYLLNDDGSLYNGWYYNGYSWLYADSSGVLYKDEWLLNNGKWYYFDGVNMISDVDEYNIDGKLYDFDSNGQCLNPYDGRILIIPD